MADGGGQPQLRQVREGGRGLKLAGAGLALSPAHLWSLAPPPQPAKLTEAFKYFVQGMGYSELTRKG